MQIEGGEVIVGEPGGALVMLAPFAAVAAPCPAAGFGVRVAQLPYAVDVGEVECFAVLCRDDVSASEDQTVLAYVDAPVEKVVACILLWLLAFLALFLPLVLVALVAAVRCQRG